MLRQGGMKAENNAFMEYRNPLSSRYASPTMSWLFSEQNRAEIWRQLWIYLAEEEKKLGIPITSKQVSVLKKNKSKVDFQRIRQWERKLKHDVMSHIKAYGEQAPEAEAIIHLGATSCYVTDNADVLILRDAADLILAKVYQILGLLEGYIDEWKLVVASGFTHFQPAQPVTMGKRLSLWAQDLVWDFEELQSVQKKLVPLGCKGATGTQASFMILMNNDYKKVKALDKAICKRMGFDRPVSVSGQTLSRKVDCWFVNALSNLASSLSKVSHDMRLLQHLGQLKEPYGKSQIGSSAMAYKRNPMMAERMTSLSRFLMSLASNTSWTQGVQWLERSLDDSANRRLVLPEAFLTADALCEIMLRLLNGLEIDQDKIDEHLHAHSRLFETEEEMMRGTLQGGSRQDLHEKVRQKTVKGGFKNERSTKAYFCGAAKEQTQDFLKEVMKPFLAKNKAYKPKTTRQAAEDL